MTDQSLNISLFGGVSAVSADGGTVDVGPAKARAVLAALALQPGAAVPVATIVDAVWGEAAPRTADKTLQSYIARLRKVLGQNSIVRAGSAYRLEIEPRSVDVIRFQDAMGAGRIDEALAAWGGTPLAGVDAPGLSPTVDGLVEQWLGAQEASLQAAIDDGPGSDLAVVIGTLTELTAAYPFREGLWALLMTALYRVGRQGDALAAYRRARAHLVDELGVEPGPRLRELEGAILDHDRQLTVSRPGDPAATIPTGTVTLGFADIGGGTGPSEPAGVELVRSAAAASGGHVFVSSGNVIGVAFHRASEAMAWVDELGRAAALHQLKVGIHSGETEERAGAFYGPVVLLAERLASVANPGQAVVSAATAALLGGNGLAELGTYRLDDVGGEQQLHQAGERRFAPLRIEERRRDNLPRRSGRLVGRDRELDELATAVGTGSVVTLIGPGGIGKTSLAVAAAEAARHGFDGGVWMVELADVSASTDVARAVMNAVGVDEASGRTLTESIVSVLEHRRALILLDNCEHVIDGAAEIAAAITAGCPAVVVLATSREGLGLVDERLVPVAPLDIDRAAVELFEERAIAASATYDPVASRELAEEICRRLDGLPLAIELAAARTRTLTMNELVDRLDDRLRLLTGGRRTSLERHRTLRATIQWSYDLLTPSERSLFERLSIFAAGFDLRAAEVVAGDGSLDTIGTLRDQPVGAAGPEPSGEGLSEAEVDDLIGGLVERSMLISESGPFGRRFRMLEAIRQFGAEALARRGESDVVARRHAAWCVDRVGVIGGLLSGHDEVEGVARLAELWPNLRVAIDWACSAGDPRTARALIEPVATEVYTRDQAEIGQWAERLLAITDPTDTPTLAFGVTWAARRYMSFEDPAGYERLVATFGEPDDPMVAYGRAFLYRDIETRLELAPVIVEMLRDRGDARGASLFDVIGHGLTLLVAGRLAEHDEMMAGLLDRYRAHGPPTCLNWALTSLGTSAGVQGRHDEASRFFAAALDVNIPPRTRSLNKPLLAKAAFERGDRVLAFTTLREYFEGLVKKQDMYSANGSCPAYVDMMLAADRVTEAALIVGYIESGPISSEVSRRPDVIAALDRLADVDDQAVIDARRRGASLDIREAVDLMIEGLGELAASGRAAVGLR